MSVFAIEYHSYYAYLFYDFVRLTKMVDDDELAQIDAITLKYVKISYDTGGGEQSHHTRSRTSGHIVVHRAYLPALLDELVPVFEKIESAKK
jgi:hypothetical protein